MTDKELLELAAKACDPAKPWKWHESGTMCLYNEKMQCWYRDDFSDRIEWNPLIEDLDAFRLAVNLGIAVTPYPIYETPKHSVIAKQYRKADVIREANPTEVVEIIPRCRRLFSGWPIYHLKNIYFYTHKIIDY